MKLYLPIIGLIYSVTVLLLLACGTGAEPRNLTVLVGAGTGTSAINAYFPSSVRVRSGDTVSWKMNAGADPHTVTFIDQPESLRDIVPMPGGQSSDFIMNPDLLFPTRREGEPVESYDGQYVNSGIFFPQPLGSSIPQIKSFSLKFEAPGTYAYVCGIHEFHRGVVIVEQSSELDLPSQDEINEQGKNELDEFKSITAQLQDFVASGNELHSEVGLNGQMVRYVAAGMGRPEAEVVEFIPRNLTVQEGDTVIWVSSRFHAVVFSGTLPVPQFYLPELGDNDRLMMVQVNSLVLLPVRNSPEYDGSYTSSGLIGYGARPGGVGFSLTFTEPGRHIYTCPIHSGMVGTITVEPK